MRGPAACRSLAVSGLALLFGPVTHAAAPTLEHLYPAGAGPGSTNVVALHGKFDPWPVQVDVEGAGVRFQCQTHSGKLEVIVTADASPGPRLVRLFNAEGAGEPRIFVVGTAPELAETEPNNSPGAAQEVPRLPATINGRLDRTGDVDSFAVKLTAGQWLEARLDAFTLMSGVDAVLRVVSSRGLELAWNHDFITFDPRIAWRSPTDQTVVVQVFGFRYPADASVVLAGGEEAVYRLHLAAASEAPDPRPPASEEVEPNDTVATAEALPADGMIRGTLGKVGDEDRFRFTTEEGKVYSITVEAAVWGSPLDDWVRVEDGDGKELAFNDDSENSRDPHLDWKAARTGEFVVAVGSRTHRGDRDQFYRLAVRKGVPALRGRALASSLVIDPGSTNELKFAVNRLYGFTGAVEVAFRDLPAGLSSGPVVAPTSDGEVSLRLVAATNAAAFSGPIRVVLVEGGSGRETPLDYELISRGENNGVPQGWWRLLLERTQRLWLTVKPKPAEKK